MTAITRKTSAATVHKMFQLLLEFPEGASTNVLWAQLASFIQSQNQKDGKSESESIPSFEDVTFSFVAPINAGWLIVEKNHWRLTEEGRRASERYAEPETLLAEAGRLSTKGWVAARFPAAYSRAGKAKDRISSEARTIRRIGVSRLIKETFGKAPSWQELLPIQAPRSIALDDIALSRATDVISYLDSIQLEYRQGGHVVYLRPELIPSTAFKKIISDYPSDAALKIAKNEGSIDDVGYITSRAKGDSKIQLRLAHGHRLLTLVANVLYLKDVGPKLYDLLEFHCGDRVWTAYVIQHIEGRTPTSEECKAGIGKLIELNSEGLIKVVVPEGFQDVDFECPSCGNNALVDEQGRFRYFDFQNFLVGNYGKFLERLAVDAAETTHFGDKTLIRGGRYLYQTVPGVKLPGKRSVNARMTTLQSLLRTAGVSVQDRLVLDVGCNIGMMMAEYLRLGAKWCHGWDRDFTIPHTEKILLALGCTRFSVTGGDIYQSRALEEDLPPFAKPMLDGCAISYLAIRGHIGWLDALKRIPWSFLVYEGHEGESAADFENYLSEFRARQNFELGPVSSYVDGDSDERTVAILFRRP